MQSFSSGSTAMVVLALAGTGAFAPGGSSGTSVPALPTPQNLGIEVESFVSGGNHIVFRSREFVQDGDLTGDGDQFDWPAFHYDVRGQRLVQLWPNVQQRAGELPVVIEGHWAAFQAAERGVDLNGDGDTVDLVAQLYDLETDTRTNLGLAVDRFNFQHFVLREGVLAMIVPEYVPGTSGASGQGADLNGDGDRLDEVLFFHDLAAGATTNTGIAASSMWISDGILATSSSESGQGADLNGDGDRNDAVVQLVHLDTGAVQNVRYPGVPFEVRGRRLLFALSESQQRGLDFNGDGDGIDRVLHTYDIDTGALVNHRLWAERSLGISYNGYQHRDGDGRYVAFYAAEAGQRHDLDGDLDQNDFVLHLYDFEDASVVNTGFSVVNGGSLDAFPAISGGRVRFFVEESYQGQDLNGDGDLEDSMLHVRELATGKTKSFGLASSPSPISAGNSRYVAFVAEEMYDGQHDLNGDGDGMDNVLYVYDAKTAALSSLGAIRGLLGSSEQFLAYQVEESPSDLNHDGDTADEVAMLYRFATGATYNLGASAPVVALAGDHLMLGVFERDQGDVDMNANGSDIDNIAHVLGLTRRSPFGR